MSAYLLLKDDRSARDLGVDLSELERDGELRGIRCPLCGWCPSASSRWCCDRVASPEPFFEPCGTEWNTFATRGRCPGCGHQWKWTSRLRCGGWSLHDDWYENGPID